MINRGIAIPKQISLVGFGDRADFAILEPALTTVSVFQDKIGAELGGMLLEKLKAPGTRLESVNFPCQIVERSSCSVPAPNLLLVGKSH